MIFNNLRIRTGSDSISSDQDWTWTEKFHRPLISAGYHRSNRNLPMVLLKTTQILDTADIEK